MMYQLMINSLMFILSTMLFTFFYKNILLNLISLEFMLINLLMMIYMNMMFLNMNIFFLSLIISITICESILGLSIMVYMIRLSGNDYMNNLNILKW